MICTWTYLFCCLLGFLNIPCLLGHSRRILGYSEVSYDRLYLVSRRNTLHWRSYLHFIWHLTVQASWCTCLHFIYFNLLPWMSRFSLLARWLAMFTVIMAISEFYNVQFWKQPLIGLDRIYS
jgi:hypothetical protein